MARVQAAGPHLRDTLQPMALLLDPSKALAVLNGSLGLRKVPRAELARGHAVFEPKVRPPEPMLVSVGVGAGGGCGA